MISRKVPRRDLCLMLRSFFLFLVSHREAKVHCSSKNLAHMIPDVGSIMSLRCNANGNKISILLNKVRPTSLLAFAVHVKGLFGEGLCLWLEYSPQ